MSNKHRKPAKKTARRTNLRWIPPVLIGLFLLLGCLCFFSALWYSRIFGRTGFDSVLYTLTSGLTGTQPGMLKSYITGCALPAVAVCVPLFVILYFPLKKPIVRKVFGKKRQVFPLHRIVAGCLGAAISLGLILHAAYSVELLQYIKSQVQGTALYQAEYKDPKKVSVTFPEKKRNLVYIILESMETSYLSEDLGGALDHNLIPELYALAQENTNFSHNDTVGGFSQISGASWTVGSMVAQTGGVPLKVPLGIKDQQNGYGAGGVFLPGLTTLQNILHDNGYYQALMVGSNSNYGGRRAYYLTHEIDAVYDLYTAREDGLIPQDYYKWWGFEDLHLFEYAKEKLTEIASKEQPFAFTMLTADTHHVGGYPCALCKRQYKENYDNVIACSSAQTAAFIAWLQQQPFYENTTVIITGDHNSMDANYFKRNVAEDYERHMYNCFINAAASTENTANRQFCAMDLFPTTLAALGCNIAGDRLGFGTNLFSDTPTLLEKFGYDYFSEELSKRAFYYSRFYD
ncbi:MAG: LTA synthase family protein [Ruminococcaceae bacterium]|nr:LTA synthase family protein [Oscillospiraceae bacterium]